MNYDLLRMASLHPMSSHGDDTQFLGDDHPQRFKDGKALKVSLELDMMVYYSNDSYNF